MSPVHALDVPTSFVWTHFLKENKKFREIRIRQKIRQIEGGHK